MKCRAGLAQGSSSSALSPAYYGTDSTTSNWVKNDIDLTKDYLLWAEQYTNTSPYYIGALHYISRGVITQIWKVTSSYDSIIPTVSISGTTLTVTRRASNYAMAISLVQLD